MTTRRVVVRLGATIGALALCSAVASAAGQAPLSFERLGPEQGLPHGTVTDILQDRDGFLWLATADGLARYDGLGFRIFRFSADEVAHGASNRIQSLLEDERRRLWIGAVMGVYRLDRRRGRFLEVASESAGTACRRSPLALDDGGTLWSGRGSAVEQFVESESAFRRFALPDGDDGWVAALERGPDGQVRALVTDADWRAPRLYSLERDRGALGPPERLDTGSTAFDLAFDRTAGAWLTAMQLPLPSHAPDGTARTPLQAFLLDREGRRWIGTGAGLFTVDPGSSDLRSVPLAEESRDWQWRYVLALAEDDAGVIWVGTLGGVFFHDPHRKPFLHVAHRRGDPASLPARAVSSIEPDGGNGLWIGTYGGGLAHLDLDRGEVDDRFAHDPERSGSICDDLIWSLLRDGSGTLWVGTESGLCRLPAGTREFHSVALPLALARAPGGARIKDLAVADGALWVGTNSGLVRLASANRPARLWSAAPAPAGLSFPEVGTLEFDGTTGSLFVGTTGAGLDRLDLGTGRVAHLPTGALDAARNRDVTIYDLASSADGTLWIASSDGLGRWRPGDRRVELPVMRSALPGSAVFSVADDRRGSLWLGTNRGLLRFDPSSGSVDSFDLGDGIGSIEFNRHAVARLAAGRLAFGGMNGLTLFDPARIRPSGYRPPAALDRVTILGAEGERMVEPWGLDELVLSPGDRAVTFDWSVLYLARSARCRSRYRLDGLDDDWIDAGTQRSARYTNLEPGRYRFAVVAANVDGEWSESGTELVVRVLPPYWRTAWFRLLVVGTAAALLALAYRLRLRRLAQLERMRLRIAGDLHDELGGDLSGIAVAAGLVARRDALEREDRDRLTGVQQTAIEVMHGLRDIVWCVDPSRDRIEDLAERLGSTARSLLADADVELDLELTRDAGALPMDLRRALFLSAKELLHNASRHAAAQHVRLRLEHVGTALHLEIEDDGVGFDAASARDGTGLASVRRRIADVGGSFDLESAPGAGTRVRLRIPFG